MKCYVQLFLLSAFIVAATCFHFRANNDGLAWKSIVEMNDVWMDDTKELTPNNFTYKIARTPNAFCILANMTISLTSQNNNSKPLDVPNTAIVEGTCSSLISELKLSWKEPAEDMNVITFTFINDHVNFSVFSIDIDIAVNKTIFSNADKSRFKGSLKNLHLFHASVKNGRHTCSKKKLTIDKMDITISNVSLIAFNTEHDISKRTEQTCSDEKENEKTFPYELKDNTGDVCTFAKWSILFDIPYKTKDNKIQQAKVKVPSDVKIIGQCGTKLSQMNLIWPETALLAADGKQNSVSFVFAKNETNTFVSTMVAKIYIEENNFPGAAELGKEVKVNTLLDHPMFLARAENGVYSCEDTKELKIDDVTVTISDVILVAFDAQKEFASKIVTDCRYVFSMDEFNYIVYGTEASIPCTLARMNITMNVPYETTQNKNDTKMLTVPSKLQVDGVCDAQWSTLTMSWSTSSEKDSLNNTITFQIAQDETATNFFVYRIDTTVQLDKKNFPDAKISDTQKSIKGSTKGVMNLFKADASAGLYRCKESIQQVKAGVIDLHITDVLFVAYNKEKDLNSKKVNDCFEPLPTTEKTTEKTTVSTTESTTESTTKSTTVTPAPDPSVKKYNYVVTNQQTHIPCVLANMTIHLTIPYKTKDSKSETKTLEVPKAETSGTCEDTNATMSLTWAPEVPKYETVQNTITFIFQTDNSTFHLQSVNVDFNLDEKNFPNAAEKKCNVTTKKLNVFSTSAKNMYRCTSATVLDAAGVQISIEDVALIAFNTEKSVASRKEENCKTEEADTNVGAIVGGTIGGIILLCIIIYVAVSWKRGRIYR